MTLVQNVVVSILLILAASCSAQSWDATTATLSQSRYNMASATTQGSAMFGGGQTDGSSGDFSGVIDVYSLHTKSWTVNHLSEKKCCLDAVGWGDLIIFIGGKLTSGDVSGQFEVFNVITGEKIIPSVQLLQPRAHHASVVTRDGELFIGGGEISGGQLTNLVEVYSLINNQITLNRTFELSAPRKGLAASLYTISYTEAHETDKLEEKLVLFAGGESEDSEATTIVDIFNRTSEIWSVTHMNSSRSYFRARSMPGYVVFAGGETVDNKLEFFNGKEWGYSTILIPRRNMASVEIGDLVMYAGGITPSGYSTNAIDIFTTSMLSRKQTSSINQYLRTERNSLSAVAIRDPVDSNRAVLVFAGGRTTKSGGASPDVDLFDIRWRKFPSDAIPIAYSIFSLVLVGLLLALLLVFSILSLVTCIKEGKAINRAFGTISSLSALPGSFLYTWLLYSTLVVGLFLAFLTIQELAAEPETPTLHLAWSAADIVAALVFAFVGFFHSAGSGGVTHFDCGAKRCRIGVSDKLHGICTGVAFGVFGLTNFSFGVYLVSVEQTRNIDYLVLMLATVELLIVIIFLILFGLKSKDDDDMKLRVRRYALKRNIRISANQILDYLEKLELEDDGKEVELVRAIDVILQDQTFKPPKEKKKCGLCRGRSKKSPDDLKQELIPKKKKILASLPDTALPNENTLNLPLFCVECLLVFFTVLTTVFASFRYNSAISWFK